VRAVLRVCEADFVLWFSDKNLAIFANRKDCGESLPSFHAAVAGRAMRQLSIMKESRNCGAVCDTGNGRFRSQQSLLYRPVHIDISKGPQPADKTCSFLFFGARDVFFIQAVLARQMDRIVGPIASWAFVRILVCDYSFLGKRLPGREVFVFEDPGVGNLFVAVVDGSTILKGAATNFVFKTKSPVGQTPVRVVKKFIQGTGIEQVPKLIGEGGSWKVATDFEMNAFMCENFLDELGVATARLPLPFVVDGGVSKEKDVAKVAVLQSLIESAYGERDIRAVSRTQRKIAGPPSCECRQTGPSLGVPDDLDQFDHAVLLGADAGN
jgi:hypothetical protein